MCTADAILYIIICRTPSIDIDQRRNQMPILGPLEIKQYEKDNVLMYLLYTYNKLMGKIDRTDIAFSGRRTGLILSYLSHWSTCKTYISLTF